jgi:hypothetical protein
MAWQRRNRDKVRKIQSAYYQRKKAKRQALENQKFTDVLVDETKQQGSETSTQ